jgi:hypothetical protein
MRVCKETFKHEGVSLIEQAHRSQVRGFFKGMTQPMIGALPYGITMFTANEMVKAKYRGTMSEEKLAFFAGCVAGG